MEYNHQDSAYGLSILTALDRCPGGSKHVYAGTVPVEVVARRRVKNRVARASRRTNRKLGA